MLLGILGVALAVALAGVVQPYKRQGSGPDRQQARLGVDGRAPAASSGVAPSPAGLPAGNGAPSPAPAAAPNREAQPLDPPSPADRKAFNGAGFVPPAIPPYVRPAAAAGPAAQAEATKGPLYYGSMADLLRVTQESQKIAQLQARSGKGPAAE